MLDPSELLDVAKQLAGAPQTRPAHLRRAISTAYYALFHHVLRTGADQFSGASRRSSAGYALLYRSFAHARMKDVCQEIDKPALRAAYKDQLQRAAVSQTLRAFARAFGELQEARHRADYDPQATVTRSDADHACALASFGIAMLDAADPDEVFDLLALMLVTGRR